MRDAVHHDRAVIGIEVLEVETGELTTAETTAVQNRHEGGIAGARVEASGAVWSRAETDLAGRFVLDSIAYIPGESVSSR